MMITTKGRYALGIALDLAAHADEGYISVKSISQRQNISMKYMELIISALNKAGIVRSMRGVAGGYQLAIPAEQLTIARVMEAAEGSLAPVSCVGLEAITCTNEDHCLTHPMWENLNHVIANYLSEVTVLDLLERRTIETELVVTKTGGDPEHTHVAQNSCCK